MKYAMELSLFNMALCLRTFSVPLRPDIFANGPQVTLVNAQGGGSSEPAAEQAKRQRIVITHGLLMSLAFLVFFPFGALTIRLLSFKGLVWLHAGIQTFAYALFTVGFGLGVYLATVEGEVSSTHPIIGIVVYSLIFFQPITGFIHHLIFKRTQKRTFWINQHLWFGRALIILGAINGGLGLQLSSNTVQGEIAYGVIAAVVYVTWFAFSVGGNFQSRGTREGKTGKKVKQSQNEKPDRSTEGDSSFGAIVDLP